MTIWFVWLLLVLQICADPLLERFSDDNSEEILEQVRKETARLIQEQLIQEQLIQERLHTVASPEQKYQDVYMVNSESIHLSEERRLQQEAIDVETQRLKAAAEEEARLSEERRLQQEAIDVEAQRLKTVNDFVPILDSPKNLSSVHDDLQDSSSASETSVKDRNVDVTVEHDNEFDYVDEALEEILQLQRQEEEDSLRIENEIVNDAVMVEELEKLDRAKKEDEEAKQRLTFQDSARSKVIDGAGRGTGFEGLLGKGKKLGSGFGRGPKVNVDSTLSTDSMASSPQDSKISAGIMNGSPNSMNAQLEELLFRQNVQSTSNDYSQTTNRNKFPRAIARPVERIIAIYNDPKTDLYDVLGISFDADGLDIKMRYRQVALTIHPDKNPHPDAKQAFEYVQEAFETLSLPLKRIEYNNKIRKGKPIKINFKKLKRRFYNEYINWKSRIELFVYRMQHGDAQVEYEELVHRPIQNIKSNVMQLRSKFVDLPSDYDRVHYLSELYFDNWKTLLRNFFMARLFVYPLC